MKIDVHSHFMSPEIARTLEKRSDFPYARLLDGTYHFHCCKGLTLPMVPTLYDMPTKVGHMDETGIDISILSLAVPGPDRVGGAQADELARIANDLLAELIAAYPDRFWGYATLGFGDTETTLKELDRCFSTLNFRGLQLFSNINGKPLDQYFCVERDRGMILAPLELVGKAESVDVIVRVNGGGTTGQTGAIVLGIGRALQGLVPESHHELSASGFLTRDSRMVERKKYGLRKARRSFQFSKR